jgi:hypothetical protein
VDPIHPIAPGPPAVPPRVGSAPVERLERVSRERDRPSREEQRQEQERRRRAAARQNPPGGGPGSDEEGEGPRHIDVRV